MKKFLVAMTIAIAALLSASCEKENHAPVPPAAETLAVDFSSFQAPATKADAPSDLDEFFTFASTQVVANWLTIFQDIINIPVEAYKQLIISSVPVESGKGWTWTVAYTDGLNQTYKVVLYGEDKGKKCNWEVRVSKDGIFGYEDFAWVTGWSTKDGHEGQWNVKVNPLDTDVLVTIDWKASDEKVETVKITYALDHLCLGINPFFNSSYVVYSASATDEAYDSSLTAYYNQMNLGFWQVDIEWNSENGAGRVRCQDQYNDTDWHCWNACHEDEE